MAATPAWQGARNLADLGGVPLRDGNQTVHGVVYRSAAPEWMTGQGWAEAAEAGLCLIVDLRNARERGRGPEHPEGDGVPGSIEVAHLPTEDPDDPAFLAECGPWLDHPCSWSSNMLIFPEKFAAIFQTIAHASGPVLVHCAGGRDRTGMVCSMMLVLADATPEAIIANYEAGFRGAAAHRGHAQSYDPETDRWVLTPDHHWTASELDRALDDRRPALREWVRTADVAGYLLDAGLTSTEVDRLIRTLRP